MLLHFRNVNQPAGQIKTTSAGSVNCYIITDVILSSFKYSRLDEQ